jgi:hypothetical protein
LVNDGCILPFGRKIVADGTMVTRLRLGLREAANEASRK